jgi:hypothetical protein
VVRKSQLVGSGPTHYISLDGVTVAALEVGEYTTFHLSEGNHTLGLIRHVADTGLVHFITGVRLKVEQNQLVGVYWWFASRVIELQSA